MTLYHYNNGPSVPHSELKSPDGKLAILYADDITDQARSLGQRLADAVRSGGYTDETKTKPETWISETERLCDIIGRIITPVNHVDIFPYLPLTKAGNFPKGQSVLVASTKCAAGANYYDYVVGQRLQLRLVPVYATEQDWLRDIKSGNVLELTVGLFDSTRKQEPIFDYAGNIQTVDRARAKYLKDDAIRQGFLYEEKSGTQYLVLTGADIQHQSHIYEAPVDKFSPDSKELEPWGLSAFLRAGCNYYIRWSAALEKRLGGDESLENIMRDFASRESDAYSELCNKLSVREQPRKFVKEIRQVYDPEAGKETHILGKPHSCYDETETTVNEYLLYAGK